MEKVRAMGQTPIGGFLPWIVYWVIASGPSSWKDGTWAALICAVLLYGDEFVGQNRPPVNITNAVTIVFFAVLSVIALFVDRSDIMWIEDYSQTISTGVLGLAVLSSLLFKVRFTEVYARAQTPREYWDSPFFKRVNRDLTVMWGVALLVIAVLGYIAQHNHTHTTLLNWVLPAIILIGMFKVNTWYPDWLRERLGIGERAGTGPGPVARPGERGT